MWKRYVCEFHQAMIAACQSKNLLSLHAIHFDKYLRYQNLVLTYRCQDAVSEHRKIFETELARDAKKAKRTAEAAYP